MDIERIRQVDKLFFYHRDAFIVASLTHAPMLYAALAYHVVMHAHVKMPDSSIACGIKRLTRAKMVKVDDADGHHVYSLTHQGNARLTAAGRTPDCRKPRLPAGADEAQRLVGGLASRSACRSPMIAVDPSLSLCPRGYDLVPDGVQGPILRSLLPLADCESAACLRNLLGRSSWRRGQ